jgi:hypothetical protein
MPCIVGAAVGAWTIIFTADLGAREAHYSLHDDNVAGATGATGATAAAADPAAAVAALFRKPPTGSNPCHNQKPSGKVNLTKYGQGTPDFSNKACFEAGVQEQAGADVTLGFKGTLATAVTPITKSYYEEGLCPVNVHWHLGAEHRSAGEYDETGTGPTDIHARRKLAGKVRQGMQCKKYDKTDVKFTKPFDWKFCHDMEVGQTYEVHWPHSKLGACKSVNQYQTPFYDGVFCNLGAALDGGLQLTPQNIASSVGVQAQVFTIVNDESYYYPDLMRGMIVDGDFGKDMAIYTGSTTGTSRSNQMCSMYSPITWQVDRKCHLISASSFDKMCADMAAQRDDMSSDFHAHGSRELVWKNLTANNQQSL